MPGHRGRAETAGAGRGRIHRRFAASAARRRRLIGSECGCFLVGGASAPMLLSKIAAIGNKSIGAEAPPTIAFAVRE
ncbi:DUF6053 domain-containing protein [Lysobacter sp. TAB13]|uniref:DUF6053 domain-containing protein n=1 Tax=Lysobacter sp. TAB13 TaxID=3233065 RepID=UPI003F9676B3